MQALERQYRSAMAQCVAACNLGKAEVNLQFGWGRPEAGRAAGVAMSTSGRQLATAGGGSCQKAPR